MTNERLDDDESVAVVITTFNDAEFLRDALASVMAQQRRPSEVILVDDGSDENPEPILAKFPQVVLIRKDNGGLASARNCGWRAAHSRFVAFLDADDRLCPGAISAGLQCFARHPDAAMVYGGHRRIRADGSVAGPANYQEIDKDAYCTLLAGNCIGMHATVLYRRDVLDALGGFDERLRRCEDYDLYLRLAREYTIASHSQIIAEYRWHGRNMSSDAEAMLRSVLAIHGRHRDQYGSRRKAWRAGQRNWRAWYRGGQSVQWDDGRSVASPAGSFQRFAMAAGKGVRAITPRPILRLVARMVRMWPPPVGTVSFGTLNTPTPVSRDFGWDRGTPVDRYYIDRFLSRHAPDIAGRVLEIGDDAYSRCYGGSRIVKQDVLHVNAENAKATIVGDLASPNVLPQDTFDCIVLTQTLQLVFDLAPAVSSLHAALKPGGVLLLTAPGISQIDRGEWQQQWCWSFTATSMRRLFEAHFRPDMLELQAFGNVYAATAFLQGVSLEEVDRAKLEIQDPAYQVIIGLRAKRV